MSSRPRHRESWSRFDARFAMTSVRVDELESHHGNWTLIDSARAANLVVELSQRGDRG